MKKSTIKETLNKQLNKVMHKDNNSLYFIGIPLKNEMMSIAIELNDKQVFNIGVMMAQSNTDFKAIALPYQFEGDINEFDAKYKNINALLEDMDDFKVKANRFFQENGSIVKYIDFENPFFRDNDPASHLADIIEKEGLQISKKIKEFKDESVLALV